MKKLFALLVISGSVFATPQEELSNRLALSEGFSAEFEQIVTSPDGDIIMEGEGTVEIARPSLFRWSTEFPDENLLVSDGENLWYYSPFIEQVSIYNQDQATSQTPFILLTRNRASDWDNYLVAQNNNTFTLTPTAIDSNQGQFEIKIDQQGLVQGFNVLEQDGQKGQFVFSNIKQGKPSKDRFVFHIPNGVEVDDQR
ncbi:outer membrane lipoprotein carrier protein LolA [Vibrio sp. 10N.286.49.B3]|uniref:outer membrane lipoprotein chaperone LolA n=1 Tax=Vibrio sp. 10N.286.49.B3 TaxID=1880855 RepID=UPI000C83B269|nr:outer membrane lipoprotein chaperone LolA [Vibrio sp. 10N.286.49.B3]PMH46774.1 outer membrane lipoprotein carrier protein LolA [Vibrio sp. 10N.286.49.B3]